MLEVTEVLRAGYPWWDQRRENSHGGSICCFALILLLQSKLIKNYDGFCMVPIWFLVGFFVCVFFCCLFVLNHRIQNPGPGSGCFPWIQKQEVAVGHIYVLYTEEWWKNILGGGERERRWLSRFSNSANVKVIADSLLHTERKHNKSLKFLCVREYAILQFSSQGLY